MVGTTTQVSHEHVNMPVLHQNATIVDHRCETPRYGARMTTTTRHRPTGIRDINTCVIPYVESHQTFQEMIRLLTTTKYSTHRCDQKQTEHRSGC